jgi:hypothetical protein
MLLLISYKTRYQKIVYIIYLVLYKESKNEKAINKKIDLPLWGFEPRILNNFRFTNCTKHINQQKITIKFWIHLAVIEQPCI